MKRVIGVPQRLFDVVIERENPTKLQSRRLVVASFNEEERAQMEAEKRAQTARDGETFYAQPA